MRKLNLVDAEPFADALTMVYMLAWQFCLPIPSFVPHLADNTSVFTRETAIRKFRKAPKEKEN